VVLNFFIGYIRRYAAAFIDAVREIGFTEQIRYASRPRYYWAESLFSLGTIWHIHKDIQGSP
jgi:hypothetical protein